MPYSVVPQTQLNIAPSAAPQGPTAPAARGDIRMNPRKQKAKDRRRARKLAEEAWQAVDEGNLDLAEKIIRRAVEAQPDNPVLWVDQGLILSLRERPSEAVDSFRAAISLAPTFADAYAHLAA